MIVRKSDNTLEEYNPSKVKHGICEAYAAVGEECPDGLIESLIQNLFIYDRVSSREIRRQVEEALMSVNKKVARAYIQRYDEREESKHTLQKDSDFIRDYINASNASTGSKYDSNANVENKNIVTLGQELHKGKNIQQNRYIMHNKIQALYSKKLANQYIKDLESHVLYKHDESGTPGYPYTYSAKEAIEVKYKGKHLFLPFDLLWDVVEEPFVMVNETDVVWQKHPVDLYVKDKDNVFTHVSVMTKKLRKRDLVRVKTAFGEDVVVTDNHPMIIDKDDVNNTIEAINSKGEKQFKINDALEFDGQTMINMAECPDIHEVSEGEWVDDANQPVMRHLELDREFGYLIGYIIGDENYNGNFTITKAKKSILEQLNDILFKKLGIRGDIKIWNSNCDCNSLTIESKVFRWVLTEVFKMQSNVEDVVLPYNLLQYNEEFAMGILEGIIDSTSKMMPNKDIKIILDSRAAIIQITALLRHFGYRVENKMISISTSLLPHCPCNVINASMQRNSLITTRWIVESVNNGDSYAKDGETVVAEVAKIGEDDSFLKQNKYIYDITTDTRSFALNNILVHNCVAITMYPFLVDGLKNLGGQSTAPTDLKSYCGEFINLVYSVSSQFMGAVATPEFLMYMDYFIRKDYGDDYLNKLNEKVELNRKGRTLEAVIENCFQQVVHSMNMPAGNRGYQTVFWNVGYFDKNYFQGVFGDFRFPDGTAPCWETLSWLQKKFMKWFNEERNKYILTFPVETMAMLTDGHDVIDKEYADFTAEMWSEGHSFFCYLSDSPDSLSSCCRLRSSLRDADMEDSEHNHTTHQFSMGTASVATGSKSVMTINLNRVIQLAVRQYFIDIEGRELANGESIDINKVKDKTKLYEYIDNSVREMTERVHKYQRAFNEIIKDFLNAKMLDVYRAGFIDMRKQYLTVGVNGLTDAAEFLGIEPNLNDDYKEFVNNILETINISNRKDRTRDCMYNTEFVPGENLSNKNYNWDKRDGFYVSKKHIMYSSYFFNPEDTSLSILDKMKLHGNEFVQYLDGGQAAHININEHLSFEQYRQLLRVASEYGCSYFTFNCKNTVCNDCGYISKHTLDSCPKCGSKNIDYLTRIIGYLKRVSSFNEARQVEESMRSYTRDE